MEEVITNSWIDDIDRNVISYIEGEDYEYLYPTVSGICITDEEYNTLKDYAEKWYKEAKITLFDILERTRKIKETDKDYNNEIFTNDLEIVWQFLSDKKYQYYKSGNTYLCKGTYEYEKIKNITSAIIRLDFVKDLDGEFKLVEANADTPCAIPETFYGNFVFTDKLDDWGKASAELGSLFNNKINFCKDDWKTNPTLIVFASSSYPEDRDNANYLYQATEAYISTRNIKNVYCELCNLEELEIFDDGVFLNGRKVNILYRLHPMELLVEDKSEDGFNIGWKLIELHYQEKVTLVNEPSAIFLQNKLLMKYLSCLPFVPRAYNENSKTDNMVICKNCYGREGEDIKVFVNMEECNKYLKDKENKDEYLVQEYIEQKPEKFIVSDIQGQKRVKKLYLTYSIFLINEEPSLTYVRGSFSPICDYTAFWIPTYGEEDVKEEDLKGTDEDIFDLKKKLKKIFLG